MDEEEWPMHLWLRLCRLGGNSLGEYYTRKGSDVYMVVFNCPYSKHLTVKTPKGTRVVKAALLNGKSVKVVETARNEYNVDMPAQEPGEPFVIKLQIKEAAGVVDKYRDALT